MSGVLSLLFDSYLQKLTDKAASGGAHFEGNVVFVRADSFVSIFQSLSLKRGLAHQECVHDASNGPDVDLITVAFFCQHLETSTEYHAKFIKADDFMPFTSGAM